MTAILRALNLVPAWLWAALLAVFVVYGGVTTLQRDAARAALMLEQKGRAEDRAAAERARADAVTAARLEEQRRTKAQETIANEATQQAERARADADANRRDADSMRQRLAEYVAAARRGAANPAAAGAGKATGDPLGVLADLLGRVDAHAGLLAEVADRSRVAGEACVRSYDALTPSGE